MKDESVWITNLTHSHWLSHPLVLWPDESTFCRFSQTQKSFTEWLNDLNICWWKRDFAVVGDVVGHWFRNSEFEHWFQTAIRWLLYFKEKWWKIEKYISIEFSFQTHLAKNSLLSPSLSLSALPKDMFSNSPDDSIWKSASSPDVSMVTDRFAILLGSSTVPSLSSSIELFWNEL